MSAADFEAFVRSYGLDPGPIVADGKWRRCRTDSHPRRRNGSYKLAADARIGWCQDFATMGEPATWKAGHDTPVPTFDPSALRKAAAEARALQVRATQAAREFYLKRCDPLKNSHPYLEAHGLDVAGCYGLRVDRNGWLVVPMFRDRNLMSVQRISPDGLKRFWPGAPTAGASYVIERAHASITVLCEGLATGLAIFNAAPLTRVVVTFTASGLTKHALTAPYTGMVAVASDNDHRTVCQRHKADGLQSPFEPWAERPRWCLCNPGRGAAVVAAETLGCAYAEPQGIQGTDWSDYRSERLEARLSARSHGSRETDAQIRRSVDAEIADAMARAAKFRAAP